MLLVIRIPERTCRLHREGGRPRCQLPFSLSLSPPFHFFWFILNGGITLPLTLLFSFLSLSSSSTLSLQKLTALREEVNAANARADAAEGDAKRLQDELIQKDHEITSLKNKLILNEHELERAESRIKEVKVNLDEGETTKTVGEGLAKKVDLLETELDTAGRNLRETTEK